MSEREKICVVFRVNARNIHETADGKSGAKIWLEVVEGKPLNEPLCLMGPTEKMPPLGARFILQEQ